MYNELSTWVYFRSACIIKTQIVNIFILGFLMISFLLKWGMGAFQCKCFFFFHSFKALSYNHSYLPDND